MTLYKIIKRLKLEGWLSKQIGYYSEKLYLFVNEELVEARKSVNIPKIIIVAKCHYQESKRVFPSVSRKELDKIVNLKKNVAVELGIKYQIYRNEKVDGFDVRTVKLNSKLISVLGEDKIYIPETDLLTISSNKNLIEVETPAGLLFCANQNDVVKSSYAKGIVENIETYKLSVGLPSDSEAKKVDSLTFPKYLLSALYSSSVAKLTRVSMYNVANWFNMKHLHLLYWGPLLTALLVYLGGNGYYFWLNESVENSIKQGELAVTKLLSKKRKLDSNKKILTTYSSEFNNQKLIHSHWNIIEQLLESGMQISRILYKENLLTIRGSAEKASNILSIISDYPMVKSASFQGSVRKSIGKDSFVLNIEVHDQNEN